MEDEVDNDLQQELVNLLNPQGRVLPVFDSDSNGKLEDDSCFGF